MKGGFLLLMTVLAARSAQAVLVYDVNFNDDMIGGLPATSPSIPFDRTPPTGPFPLTQASAINFGTPTVVSGLGPLNDQPLVFQTDIGGEQLEQIQFTLNLDAPRYQLDLDLVVEHIEAHQFSVVFDFVNANRIDFRADGTIALCGFIIGSIPCDDLPAIATYQTGVPLHLSTFADLDADTMFISLNSAVLVDGPMANPALKLELIRLNLQDLSHSSLVAVDNIEIQALPELAPTALLLFAAAFSVAALPRTRVPAAARGHPE